LGGRYAVNFLIAWYPVTRIKAMVLLLLFYFIIGA